ncbi:MAG: aldo/keto reductase [Kiritimatiellae bacterium]|jgi:predicted aldo/keto reductase-like oxidoreductase|nr:aldo/keto reductase [Kiritimatiellia bacterium]
MQYTILGKTGLKVSRLGFGAMRLPMTEEKLVDRDKSTAMFHKAIEAGVNYLDTAVFYCHEDSQKALGDAIQGKCREDLVISTKNHYFEDDEKMWWTNLENSLNYIKTDYIDIYNTHGIQWKAYKEKVEPRISKWLIKAKDQGLIRHIGTSFHDDLEALKKVVDTGFYESITLQYNLLNQGFAEGIDYAKAAGMGVVVMGPVAGGQLDTPSQTFGSLVSSITKTPELAMRFVLANPNVDVALSGMSTMQQVEENLATCSDPLPLTPENYEQIKVQLEKLKKMSDLYCTGCGYCTPCPEKIPIPKIFELYNKARVYDILERSKKSYNRIGTNPKNPENKADACTECGACEKKCPQNIPIRQQLKDACQMLA